LHQYETLPVIVGVQTENLSPKLAVMSAELKAALELISKSTKLPDKEGEPETVPFQARMLDITKGYCVVLKDHNGTQITFGLDDIDGQLERLKIARKTERELSQQMATVNLMLARNIPITWVPPVQPEDSDFPPKPAENPKPTTKDLKQKVAKKPEGKAADPKKDTKELKKEPKKSNPDNGIYKPFLLRA
jgi:hypothetical protein